MEVGETRTWIRSFQEDEVREFSRLSGDAGRHHVMPDEQGRLMVQGLLTATLPSKIGGDLDFLAREMTFHFERPVFTGDTIRCRVTIDRVDGPPERRQLACSWTCTNQDGAVVMTGASTGVVVQPAAGRPKGGAGPPRR